MLLTLPALLSVAWADRASTVDRPRFCISLALSSGAAGRELEQSWRANTSFFFLLLLLLLVRILLSVLIGWCAQRLYPEHEQILAQTSTDEY